MRYFESGRQALIFAYDAAVIGMDAIDDPEIASKRADIAAMRPLILAADDIAKALLDVSNEMGGVASLERLPPSLRAVIARIDRLCDSIPYLEKPGEHCPVCGNPADSSSIPCPDCEDLPCD